jgi:hypothetical protein
MNGGNEKIQKNSFYKKIRFIFSFEARSSGFGSGVGSGKEKTPTEKSVRVV